MLGHLCAVLFVLAPEERRMRRECDELVFRFSSVLFFFFFIYTRLSRSRMKRLYHIRQSHRRVKREKQLILSMCITPSFLWLHFYFLVSFAVFSRRLRVKRTFVRLQLCNTYLKVLAAISTTILIQSQQTLLSFFSGIYRSALAQNNIVDNASEVRNRFAVWNFEYEVSWPALWWRRPND